MRPTEASVLPLLPQEYAQVRDSIGNGVSPNPW
jgi:hypothetical protein